MFVSACGVSVCMCVWHACVRGCSCALIRSKAFTSSYVVYNTPYMINYSVCTYIFTQNITKQLTPNFQGFTNLVKACNVMLKVAADINET